MIRIVSCVLNALANKICDTESKSPLNCYFSPIRLFGLFMNFPKYWQRNKSDLCQGCL